MNASSSSGAVFYRPLDFGCMVYQMVVHEVVKGSFYGDVNEVRGDEFTLEDLELSVTEEVHYKYVAWK